MKKNQPDESKKDFLDKDFFDRALLIKLLQLNHSTYKINKDTPESFAAKYGYNLLEEMQDLSTGYYACALKKEEAREILIAHRGTQADAIYKIKKGDWSASNLKQLVYETKTGIQDDLKLTFGQIADQAFPAIGYTNQIVSAYKDYKIVQTGHSLGGYLAQAAYLFCDIDTYVFECPGAESSLDRTSVV